MLSARLLLLSSSRVFGSGFLDHAEAEIRGFLGSRRRVAFVPYALDDRKAYAERARRRLEAMGLRGEGLDETDPTGTIRRAEAIFVGGGNTFRLLDALQKRGLLQPIRERVAQGLPYIGSSAGSIVAGPTIQTTKDMPIVQPASFEALGLTDFQISPHYLDADPSSTHVGETQEERIAQYHEENRRAVAGLREGAMLRIQDGEVRLCGAAGARVFRRDREAVERVPICRIDDLLGETLAT